MVKESIKKCKKSGADSATLRMLDHRQLGLKLIANVTYGYTAANFSGRMPCVELGDSIVHKARETLERAIDLVMKNSKKWEGARVVYGDTDSMFIEFPGVKGQGCSKERAFEVGREIAKVVTDENPTPVKLKFEKVYLPCVLQTKKRYVGYAYESEDQKEPLFDAKGIETVRRDGTPATAKILEKMLKILFDTRDVSKVKSYVQKQCAKVLDGRSTIQDCIIAKEYRGMEYYKPGAVVPALNIARKMIAIDKRSEPRSGERVPYLISHGPPGTPLYQLVKTLPDMINNQSLRLNGTYYVTKQILPALDRIMSLLGVDVFQWYRDLPRVIHHSEVYHTADTNKTTAAKKTTLSQFFKSKHCLLCKNLSRSMICEKCSSSSSLQTTAVNLACEVKAHEKKIDFLNKICMNCTGCYSPDDVNCSAYNCPILYKKNRVNAQNSRISAIKETLDSDEFF